MRISTHAILLLILIGCGGAAPPPVYPSPQPLIVQAPQDQIWQAAIDLATEMNFPISTIDAHSGYLRTDVARIQEPRLGEWWDCSYQTTGQADGAMPDWEKEMLERNASKSPKEEEPAGLAPSGQISIAFTARSEGTQLRVMVSNLALRSPGRTTGRECQSKGAFEQKFASMVVERWRDIYKPK